MEDKIIVNSKEYTIRNLKYMEALEITEMEKSTERVRFILQKRVGLTNEQIDQLEDFEGIEIINKINEIDEKNQKKSSEDKAE